MTTLDAEGPAPLQAGAPATIEALLGEGGAGSNYARLVALEEELDFKIAQRHMRVVDAAFKTVRTRRTLKVYISHKIERAAPPSADYTATTGKDGEEEGLLVVRIEGRLEPAAKAAPRSQGVHRPLSHFISSLLIQFVSDGRPATDDVVEWRKGPGSEECDGFEVRRPLTKAFSQATLASGAGAALRIFLRLDYQPERFAVSPALAGLLGITLGTRPQVILALWQYIKARRLQESDEKKIVDNDEALRAIFACDRMTFAEIPMRVQSHLHVPPPILLEYAIAGRSRPASPWTLDEDGVPALWEVDVEVEEAPQAARPGAATTGIVSSASQQRYQRAMAALDERITDTMNGLRVAIHQHTIYDHFARDPAGSIEGLLAAQCSDHQEALGQAPLSIADVEGTAPFASAAVRRAVSIMCASSTPFSPLLPSPPPREGDSGDLSREATHEGAPS